MEPPFCRLQGSASDAEPWEEKVSLGYPSPPKLSAFLNCCNLYRFNICWLFVVFFTIANCIISPQNAGHSQSETRFDAFVAGPMVKGCRPRRCSPRPAVMMEIDGGYLANRLDNNEIVRRSTSSHRFGKWIIPDDTLDN